MRGLLPESSTAVFFDDITYKSEQCMDSLIVGSMNFGSSFDNKIFEYENTTDSPFIDYTNTYTFALEDRHFYN